MAKEYQKLLDEHLEIEAKKYEERKENVKRKQKNQQFEYSELDLIDSKSVNEFVEKFNKISREIGDTEPVLYKMVELLVRHPSSWPRIRFIFSIIKKLLSQNPMPSTLIVVEPDIDNNNNMISRASMQQEPQVTIPQLLRFFPNFFNINFPSLWMGAICFLLIIMREHERDFVQVKLELVVALVKVVKGIFKMCNTLPKILSEVQFECVDKSHQFIDALLVGRGCSGVGVVSFYQIIVELPNIYGEPVNGRFKYVHWSMEQIIDELCKRRKKLSQLMIPPGNRSHEYVHLASLPNNTPFASEYQQLIKDEQTTDLASHFRDMFFQHAPIEEVKLMVKLMKSSRIGLQQIRAAIRKRVLDVLKYTQRRCDFRAIKDYSAQPSEMLIPENLDYWELILEVADQLYSLVAADYLKYEDLLTDFVNLVHSNNSIEPRRRPIIAKDNTLIWLLLQLWRILFIFSFDFITHIENVSKEISKDLQSDERLFLMFISLYNENQIKSRDAFYLRDLSLPCGLILQHESLKNKNNLKYRHPSLAPAFYYSPLCHELLRTFPKAYKEQVTNHDLFRDLPLQKIIELATVSQAQKIVVANTLYVYLVPDMSVNISKLGFQHAKFLKGGNFGYKLLEYLNVCQKHRLAQIIYKMMLGDSLIFKDTSQQINCVSPYVLDVVYKVLYGAPWSLELMMLEIFQKLKKVDISHKIKIETISSGSNNVGGSSNSGGANSEQQQQQASSENLMYWQHTILELFNFRLLRFLKFLPRAPDFFDYIKYSLSHLEHRQMYRGVEMFAIHAMMIQINVKFIRSIADPNRDKPIWFAESEMLARIMILTISRLIKFRGFSDISPELVQNVLDILCSKPLAWSENTLKYFPDSIKLYLANQTIEKTLEPKDVINKIYELFKTDNTSQKLLKGVALEKSEEELLAQQYSQVENQPILLCIIWTICVVKKQVSSTLMEPLRKLLLHFPPSRMSTYTIDMVDFVVDQEYDTTGIEVPYRLLGDLIWTYQIVAFEHVIFALIRGNRDHDHKAKVAFGFLDYLLFKSEGFQSRVDYFISLNFNPRYWTEDDYHDKLMKYLEKYPEFFEFEAFAMDGYENVKKILDPPVPTQMPIYYSFVIARTLPILDIVIGRLIEYGEKEMLIKLLEKYGCLYKYHQTPLSFIRDLFQYYHSDTLRDPIISKKLLHLLDFGEYDIAPELLQYASDEQNKGEIFDEKYFHRVFQKLADYMSPKKCGPKPNSKLPEKHYREVSNPTVQALYIACIEIMATPVAPENILTMALDIVLGRDRRHTAVAPIVIHAIALIFSFLPADMFLLGTFNEIINVVKSDAHLLEFSVPCNLSRKSFRDHPPGQTTSSSNLPPSTTSTAFPPLFSALSLDDVLRPTGLHTDPSSTLSQLQSSPSLLLQQQQSIRTIMFPYIFNDYISNLHNYTTNVPNSFLTFIHSLLHYSNTEMLELLLSNLMLKPEDGIRTDTQILYLCALLGPVLYRMDKAPITLKEFLLNILHLLHHVTSSNMRVEDITTGQSTLALEQIYDFLHHVKPLIASDHQVMLRIQNIVRLMKPSIQNRLCGFMWIPDNRR
ncbi:10890_t:CDS:10 [Ambispora gerdemannii]|uniref:10890_t:CDS:1 n=1 Tax=Ambispora gerdemannii TaxID=144530 RepID=A0A9N9G7Z8_9GLOM|nr:10890_t:CDS:10 [Ambispora gerdemannii]